MAAIMSVRPTDDGGDEIALNFWTDGQRSPERERERGNLADVRASPDRPTTKPH